MALTRFDERAKQVVACCVNGYAFALILSDRQATFVPNMAQPILDQEKVDHSDSRRAMKGFIVN